MLRFACLVLAAWIFTLTFSTASHAQEPKTLLGQIAEWQYPGSTIGGAVMSDAATLNASGDRTIASLQCRTVMTTSDPIAKVLDYYHSKVKAGVVSDGDSSNDKPKTDSGRSVTFHDDSEDRPVAIHIILINTEQTSTTLVISRAEGEAETHIAWTQYIKV